MKFTFKALIVSLSFFMASTQAMSNDDTKKEMVSTSMQTEKNDLIEFEKSIDNSLTKFGKVADTGLRNLFTKEVAVGIGAMALPVLAYNVDHFSVPHDILANMGVYNYGPQKVKSVLAGMVVTAEALGFYLESARQNEIAKAQVKLDTCKKAYDDKKKEVDTMPEGDEWYRASTVTLPALEEEVEAAEQELKEEQAIFKSYGKTLSNVCEQLKELTGFNKACQICENNESIKSVVKATALMGSMVGLDYMCSLYSDRTTYTVSGLRKIAEQLNSVLLFIDSHVYKHKYMLVSTYIYYLHTLIKSQ